MREILLTGKNKINKRRRDLRLRWERVTWSPGGSERSYSAFGYRLLQDVTALSSRPLSSHSNLIDPHLYLHHLPLNFVHFVL